MGLMKVLVSLPLLFGATNAVAGDRFEFHWRIGAGSIVQRIDTQIQNAHRAGRTPLIIVDLDDTVLLNATRNAFYVRKLAEQDSRFLDLANVKAETFIGKTWDDWVGNYLSQRRVPAVMMKDLKAVFSDLKTRYRFDGIQEDEVISLLVDQLRKWSSEVKILYLTAREKPYESATRLKLRAENFPPGEVRFKPNSEESSAHYKKRVAEEVLMSSDLVLVATFDDDSRNLMGLSQLISSEDTVQPVHVQVQLEGRGSRIEVGLRSFGACAARAFGF